MAIDITGPSISRVSGDNKSGSLESKNRDAVSLKMDQQSPSRADSLTLTRDSDMLKKIENTINERPIDNNDKINRLKASIDSGGYNIDPKRVADKFIQFEISLTG
ncbi:MAG: flagellar biosynthesis anti-sigma factor FlgM [Gammaproteobacteria bacterium]|nr:flagellar biosynthesis anti-sigma factor FlgM [Gammaproteobacteria bacterium]